MSRSRTVHGWLLRISLLLALGVGCDEAQIGPRPGSVAAASSLDARSGGAPVVDAARGDTGASGNGGVSLASRYPGDVGLASDPAVVFSDNFEAGSVQAILGRYSSSKNAAGMALERDRSTRSSGATSLKLTAGGSGPSATDLFKILSPGHDELYLRYYVKYQGGIDWHHTAVALAGFNPPSDFPKGIAGVRPTGSDHFSVQFEPIGRGANQRMDFYNYWMKMRSWMDAPQGSNTAYYGNTLIHRNAVRVTDNRWMCIEIHVRLNPDPGAAADAELAVFIDDTLIQRFTDTAPLGYWIKDKFCPRNADSPECTNYPPRPGTPMEPLDLQFRTTTDLRINALWVQNYITSGPGGSVWVDDLVVATSRIGCLR